MNLHKILPQFILKRVYQNILRHSSPDFDLDVGRNSTPAVLLRLKALGFSPAHILDIGAFEGKWTAMAAPIFQGASFHLFEALPYKRVLIEKNLSGIPHQLYMILLGAENRMEVSYNALESGSGVFPEKTEIKRETLCLPMSRLDSVLNFDQMIGPVFMKLDVQGYELEVLKGVGNGLKKIDALYLELSTIEYNSGAPSFRQVIEFLDDHGFNLFDLGESHRKVSDHTLLQVDGLFLANNSSWYQKACNLSGKDFRVYSV